MTNNLAKPMLHHTYEIYPEIYSSIAQRRGDVHLYSKFDPQKSALVVIDMQNCWVMEGQPGFTPYASSIVDNINRVAQAMREAGGLVVWVQMNASREVTLQWQRFRDIYANQAELDAWHDALTPGSMGFELWAGLDVRPQDRVLVKNRYSAFIQGASEIDQLLRGLGVDTVLVAGVATNTCCESTARDAQMLNYKVIMVADGNATRSDVEHSAALSNLLKMFADVQSTDDILAHLMEESRLRKLSSCAL